MRFLAFLLLAHSWYPRECCTDRDCKPVPCELTEGRIRGVAVIIYTETGKNYYAEMRKVRPSPDDQCHVCIQSGTQNMRCVFVPEKLS